MHFSPFLVASLLLNLLPACQSQEADPLTPDAGQNYVKVTFDGQTTTYTSASFTKGQLGSLVSRGLTAHDAGGYLTVDVFGTQAGTYAFRKDVNQYAQVSQIEYRMGGTNYTNYKAVVCPTSSGYYSTDGQVVIDYDKEGRRMKGTFSGSLLDQNEADQCNKVGKPISGEFSLTVK